MYTGGLMVVVWGCVCNHLWKGGGGGGLVSANFDIEIV